MITVDDLPPALRSVSDEGWIRIRLGSSFSECEKIIIRDTLSFNHGNKSKTAQTLEMSRKTLFRKLTEYSLGDGGGEEEE